LGRRPPSTLRCSSARIESVRGRDAGVVYIHSSPAAVCPHVEWALTSALGSAAKLRWTPTRRRQLRATSEWTGPVGTAARIAQSLRSWPVLRFRVTEDPSEGVDGNVIVSCLDSAFGTVPPRHGDVTLGEMRVRACSRAQVNSANTTPTTWPLKSIRATRHAMDEDLEIYRYGTGSVEVTWLRRRRRLVPPRGPLFSVYALSDTMNPCPSPVSQLALVCSLINPLRLGRYADDVVWQDLRIDSGRGRRRGRTASAPRDTESCWACSSGPRNRDQRDSGGNPPL